MSAFHDSRGWHAQDLEQLGELLHRLHAVDAEVTALAGAVCHTGEIVLKQKPSAASLAATLATLRQLRSRLQAQREEV